MPETARVERFAERYSYRSLDPARGVSVSATSREPGLTAGFPDVFEAKLVFSDQEMGRGRRIRGRELFVICVLCSVF